MADKIVMMPDLSLIISPEATLADLSDFYVQIREQRLELEKEATALKDGPETELKQQILALLSAQGLKSANLADGRKLVSRQTIRMDISNIDRLCQKMFEDMIKALEEERPISDGLLFQKRAHKDNILTLIGEDDAQLAACGIQKVTKIDLAVLNAKGAK